MSPETHEPGQAVCQAEAFRPVATSARIEEFVLLAGIVI